MKDIDVGLNRRWTALELVSLRAAVMACAALGFSVPLSAQPSLSIVRSADGTELLVAQEGNQRDPGILMIHGYAQSYLSFRRQFDSALAAHFHLVAFDLRGHGGSAKPFDRDAYAQAGRWADDVAAVIKATSLDRPVILGWSFGGIVAGDYVGKYGARCVSGVVLAGTLGGLIKPALPPAAQTTPKSAAIHASAVASRALDLAQNIAAGDIISRAYLAPGMTSHDLKILFATEMMLPAYARRGIAARSLDHSDLVARLALVPMLFVRGEYDMGMGEAELKALGAKLPLMRVSRYSHSGHLTFLEKPERFNAELGAFALSAEHRSDPAMSVPRPTLPMSAAAHRAFRDREFAARDGDHDGKLDAAEMALVAGHPLSPEELRQVMRMNCGHDGPGCALADFRAQGDADFKFVDRDGDGLATAAELKQAGNSFHAPSAAKETSCASDREGG